MTSERLDRAIESLAVLDVFVRETSAWLAKGFDPKRHTGTPGVQVRHEAGSRIDILDGDEGEQIAVFPVSTGVRLTERDNASAGDGESGSPRILAELTATFVAEYRITTSSPPEHEALEEFAQMNVLYHVWPYWREYVQSMCGRLRLPEIMLPMFRLPEGHRRSTMSE